MANKIILSADSTCDLSPELKERYQVQYFPYHILLDGQQYMDGVDIQPEDLYRTYREKKLLPKTAAISTMEFYEYFKQWVDEGYEVIHINLGSALSAAHQMGTHGRQGKQAADAQQGKRVPDGTGHRHGSHVRRAGLTGHGRVHKVHAHL